MCINTLREEVSDVTGQGSVGQRPREDHEAGPGPVNPQS